MAMDPHYEQRLRDEVIYLHSLWHQGPPSSTRHPHPHLHLQPSTSTQFKKERKNPKSQKFKNKSKTKLQKPPQDSGIDWPCPPVPDPDPSPAGPSGWPNFTKTQPNSEPRLPPSPGQQARFVANQSQFKAQKAVNGFFKSMDSDSDSGDDGDELMGDGEEEVENEGSEYSFSGFLAKLFEEDSQLREFYAKNYENGEFSCLVCGGVGKNKRFKDCVALVQHTITIAKTKKRKAHRAYGQVVCKILGWDIDKLPSIVASISEKRNGFLSKSGEGEGEAQANSDNGNKDIAINVVDNVDCVKDNNDEENQGKESIGAEQLPDNGESTVSESPLFVSDPNGRAEDLSDGVAEGVLGNTESVLNCMEPRKEEDTDGKETEDNQEIDTVVDDSKEREIQN